MKKRNVKNQNLIRLALLLVILVLVNVISSFLFTRIDLTEDKRYTLSNETKTLLGDLEDVVFLKVYLEGEFPPGFRRLSNSTKEMLDEMRNYSNENLEYEFIDPSESESEQQRNQLYQQLAEKGLQPTNLEEQSKEGSSQKIIFPGAIISYRAKESVLQLLKDKIGANPEQMLNNSIQNLEFELANSIKKITSLDPLTIGMHTGNGELHPDNVADIVRTLSESYNVSPVAVDSSLKSLKNYDLLILAKPTVPFSEKTKFIIDQFVMKGGRLLVLADGMKISMDSLQDQDYTVAISNELNLDDMLFKYGARINKNLLMDLMAAPIPIVTGYVGNQAQQSLLPWYYFPLINPQSEHPIVKNLNAIRSEFISTVDTIAVPGIKKSILLSSSQYSRAINAPARVSLGIMREDPDVSRYNKSYLPLAVLLEGEFQSLYKSRVPKAISEDEEINFRESGDSTKIIVIGDGDMISNYANREAGRMYPLGYDRFTRQFFGNKNFLLNAIDYLVDDSGLLSVRSKEIKLRLLDQTKVDAERQKWQIINIGIPLIIVILFGIIRMISRRRKFAK
ncbi:MAG: gliding motility-associated ABC transporter substrate-binding protein GldG [Bacteroidia bacterium]|nr:gliding motility-associated ABC transporter substrate-binding protein GldG [Bacteroidia bacterium]